MDMFKVLYVPKTVLCNLSLVLKTFPKSVKLFIHFYFCQSPKKKCLKNIVAVYLTLNRAYSLYLQSWCGVLFSLSEGDL